MKLRLLRCLSVALVWVVSSGFGQEGGTAKTLLLEDDFAADKENQMMRAYLREHVHTLLDQRLEQLEALETPEQIGEYQDRLRAFFRETTELDTFERTPLNPETTGRLNRDGYAVEKVIFESQPKFHVTGNLYLPDRKGPHPAILHACGHTENGKANETYQKVNILLAQSGFVVLCYDPIGQGERKQLIDDKGRILRKGSSEHMALGVAPILLGRGLSSFMIWDGMRAIDYLQSRPEVDPDQIGCTGNSGGGNMTSYLMALDERIQAAAPGCFMTTTRMKNESPGPGDAEQNLFAQIREGLDHPDFAIIRAPKPTLILAATHDFVPIEGTWDAFRQTKRVYTKLGFPERVDLVEAPEKHGFSKQLREGAARFFCRWLKQEHVVVFEPDEVPTEKEIDLLCAPQGQVLQLEGERLLIELNAELAKRLETQREAKWSSLTTEEKRLLIRKATGIRSLKGLPEPRPEGRGGHGSFSGGGFSQFSKGFVQTEPGIRIPFCSFYGQSHSGPEPNHIRLACIDEKWDMNFPKRADSLFPKPSDQIEDCRMLIAVNLRDSGFSKTRNWRFYGADAYIAYMLGRSYLAMRTEDLLVTVRTLRKRENVTHIIRKPANQKIPAEADKKTLPIHLHADAEFVPVAIHAAALEPDLFESVNLHGGLTTWQTVIESRDPMPHFHNVIHGALQHYDLADLLKMIPEEKLNIVEAIPD